MVMGNVSNPIYFDNYNQRDNNPTKAQKTDEGKQTGRQQSEKITHPATGFRWPLNKHTFGEKGRHIKLLNIGIN